MKLISGMRVKAYVSKLDATIIGEVIESNNATTLLKFISSNDNNMFVKLVKQMSQYNVRIDTNKILQIVK